MAEVKRINNDEFVDILSNLKFDKLKLAKDYFVTLLLYLIKDVEGIYFKGGTALHKIILDHAGLSEDLDFTLSRNVLEVKKEITRVVDESNLFEGITQDKNVEGFLRMAVHYKDFEGTSDAIFIDLNQRGKLVTETENHEIKHFYLPFIPKFSVKTVGKKEIIAEKMAAAIGMNKPRDHFDVYMILKEGLPIDLTLVRVKCEQSGHEFSIIKMFNQAKKLKNRWDKDMVALLSEPITYQEVIKTLAKYFKLKEEKVSKEETLDT